MKNYFLVIILLAAVYKEAAADNIAYCPDTSSVKTALNESQCKPVKVNGWEMFCSDSIHLNPFSDFFDNHIKFSDANLNYGSMFGTFKNTGIVCAYSDTINTHSHRIAYAMKGVANQFQPDPAGDWSNNECVPGLKIKSKNTFVQDVILFASGFLDQMMGRVGGQINTSDSDQKAVSRCGFISK